MRKSKIILLLPALAVLACTTDSVLEENTEEQLEIQKVNEELTEEAFPEDFGPVSEVYFAGKKISVEEQEGEYVYQGDIIFSQDMLSSQPKKLVYEKGEIPQQKSTGRTSGRWPNNTVYYAVDGNLSDKNRVYDAIKHWQSKTSLQFVERSGESNYVYFTSGSGCSSYIGMIGGKQNITLSTSCTTGNTIHEIGHAIGLWHEQSRVDRENHISINYENIQSGREHNFDTYEEGGFDGDEFTSNLDFSSIMMYGPTAFSKNGLPTIEKANGSSYSVQRTSLSSGDIQGVDTMYPGDTSTTTEPTYINGEYYTIDGLTVLRYNDRWYYYKNGMWRQVKNYNGFWFYA